MRDAHRAATRCVPPLLHNCRTSTPPAWRVRVRPRHVVVGAGRGCCSAARQAHPCAGVEDTTRHRHWWPRVALGAACVAPAPLHLRACAGSHGGSTACHVKPCCCWAHPQRRWRVTARLWPSPTGARGASLAHQATSCKRARSTAPLGTARRHGQAKLTGHYHTTGTTGVTAQLDLPVPGRCRRMSVRAHGSAALGPSGWGHAASTLARAVMLHIGAH